MCFQFVSAQAAAMATPPQNIDESAGATAFAEGAGATCHDGSDLRTCGMAAAEPAASLDAGGSTVAPPMPPDSHSLEGPSLIDKTRFQSLTLGNQNMRVYPALQRKAEHFLDNARLTSHIIDDKQHLDKLCHLLELSVHTIRRRKNRNEWTAIRQLLSEAKGEMDACSTICRFSWLDLHEALCSYENSHAQECENGTLSIIGSWLTQPVVTKIVPSELVRFTQCSVSSSVRHGEHAGKPLDDLAKEIRSWSKRSLGGDWILNVVSNTHIQQHAYSLRTHRRTRAGTHTNTHTRTHAHIRHWPSHTSLSSAARAFPFLSCFFKADVQETYIDTYIINAFVARAF